jgi:hypothetical protein
MRPASLGKSLQLSVRQPQMATVAKLYPGDSATAREILELAAEYQKAAGHLASLGRKRRSISWNPFRLCAIHSVELYLNALLLHRGHSPQTIRGMQHDLTARTNMAMGSGFILKKATVEHLHALAGSREYLVTRYSPKTASCLSELTRLKATLAEVAMKVSSTLDSAKAGPPNVAPVPAAIG